MSNFNEAIDSTFKQKADMATVFVRALDRKNMAGTYDYPSGISVVLNNLPVKWAEWVRAQSDLWQDEVDILTYKSISGIKMGYKDNPLVWNDDHTRLGLSNERGFNVNRLPGEIDWSDPNIEGKINAGTEEEPIWVPVLINESQPVKRLLGEIDWNDPRIYSPYKSTEIKENYEIKDSLVHTAAEFASLTWTIDPLEQDAGDTEEYVKVQRKKTPLRLSSHLQKLLKKAIELEEEGVLIIE